MILTFRTPTSELENEACARSELLVTRAESRGSRPQRGPCLSCGLANWQVSEGKHIFRLEESEEGLAHGVWVSRYVSILLSASLLNSHSF